MAVVRVSGLKVDADGSSAPVGRDVPDEVPIAVVHDGATHAVMMATPADLEDFAVGFSLSEGVIGSEEEIAGLEVVSFPEGWELRMWLTPRASRIAIDRRRRITGPTGCGLCGVESLQAARQPARKVSGSLTVDATDVVDAMRALSAAQPLGRETRATHAAGLVRPGEGVVAVREDVGRHNALDKLIGHFVRAGIEVDGMICVITSRVSIEMVQKAAVLGTTILVAVSAPTALAVETAEAAGITLCAVARDDGFEVFTHPERIRLRR
jgi:FdhD protein